MTNDLGNPVTLNLINRKEEENETTVFRVEANTNWKLKEIENEIQKTFDMSGNNIIVQIYYKNKKLDDYSKTLFNLINERNVNKTLENTSTELTNDRQISNRISDSIFEQITVEYELVKCSQFLKKEVIHLSEDNNSPDENEITSISNTLEKNCSTKRYILNKDSLKLQMNCKNNSRYSKSIHSNKYSINNSRYSKNSSNQLKHFQKTSSNYIGIELLKKSFIEEFSEESSEISSVLNNELRLHNYIQNFGKLKKKKNKIIDWDGENKLQVLENRDRSFLIKHRRSTLKSDSEQSFKFRSSEEKNKSYSVKHHHGSGSEFTIKNSEQLRGIECEYFSQKIHVENPNSSENINANYVENNYNFVNIIHKKINLNSLIQKNIKSSSTSRKYSDESESSFEKEMKRIKSSRVDNTSSYYSNNFPLLKDTIVKKENCRMDNEIKDHWLVKPLIETKINTNLDKKVDQDSIQGSTIGICKEILSSGLRSSNTINLISTQKIEDPKTEIQIESKIDNYQDITKLYGIIALPDDSISIDYNGKDDNIESILDADAKDNEKIIDINAMHIVEENFIDYDLKSSNLNNDIVNISYVITIPDNLDFDSHPCNNDISNANYEITMNNSLVLYPPYYSERGFDIELTSQIEEIDNLMKSITLNEHKKSLMKFKHNSNITFSKNLKEVLLKKSYLSYYLNSFPIDSILLKSSNNNFRINFILDIDHTLICAELKEKINDYQNLDDEKTYEIQPIIKFISHKLIFKIRKYVIEFLQKISQFCNIYIYTHGQEAYANEVIKVLSAESKIIIKEQNIRASKNTLNYEKKTISAFSSSAIFSNNTLILDDTAKAWKDECFDNLIQSTRYMCFFNSKVFDEKQIRRIESNGLNYLFGYLLVYNRIQEINDYSCRFIDENNVPFSLEYEYSKKFQIVYIDELIEKIYKLCLLKKISAKESLRQIRQSVLAEVYINLQFINNEANYDSRQLKYLKEIITVLGGKIETTDKTSTHFIISPSLVSEFNNHVSMCSMFFKNRKIYYLNIKWIFHCYFFVNKMDENDPEYKIV